MELKGTHEIEGSEREIWEILHSAEHLKNIVPGCTAIENTDDGRYKAFATLKIGPMKVNFEEAMEFDDISPYSKFQISGQGEGGPAGFVKGSADIELVPTGNGVTTLSYTAHSDIGGKLASLGSRLIEAISRKNIEGFFQDLQAELSGPIEIPQAAEMPQHAGIAPAKSGKDVLPLINTLLLAAATIALWVIALK